MHATAAGQRAGSRCGGRPRVRGSGGPEPISRGLVLIRVSGHGAPIPPRDGRGRPGLGPSPGPCSVIRGPAQKPLISGWLRSKLIGAGTRPQRLLNPSYLIPPPRARVGPQPLNPDYCISGGASIPQPINAPTRDPLASPPAGWPRRTGAAWAGRSRGGGRRDARVGASPGTGRDHDRSSETVVKWSTGAPPRCTPPRWGRADKRSRRSRPRRRSARSGRGRAGSSRARRSSASPVGAFCPPLTLLTCAPASTAGSRARARSRCERCPSSSAKLPTISPRRPGASPGTGPSGRPKSTLARWVPCRLIPPLVARPRARAASGIRSAPATQGSSRSTGPSSTATQTRGSPLPPPRVPPEIRDARDGRDVCHWCPSVCSTIGPIWLDGS